MRKAPTLWVFNQHYPPDVLATGQVLQTVCSGLVELGWDVTVITGAPYRLAENVAWKRQRSETSRGVKIIRVPSWNRRDGTVGRLLHYGVYTLAAAASWLKRERPDICLCLTTPPVFAGFQGVTGLLLKDVPFVYNIQDLFPDILETSDYAGSWIETLGRLFASPVEQHAAALTPIGKHMAQRLIERHIPEEKIVLIPNPVDTTTVVPVDAEQNEWLKNQNLDSGLFRVLYAGNFGHAQGLETVLEAAAKLQDQKEIQFLLVGEGDAKKKLLQMSSDMDNVKICPFAPAEQISEVLSAGHVGLVPLKAGMQNFLVPSKAINYLSAGTPIIGASDTGGELQELIETGTCGYSVEPGNCDQLVNAILRARTELDQLKQMGETGRHLVTEKYAGPVIVHQYDELLRSIIKEDRNR